MGQFPDPKELVDSVVDGAVELAEGPVRVATKVANVAETFASDVKSNMDNIKSRLPDDPSAIPDIAIKGAGDAIKAGIGFFEAIGSGAMETLGAIKDQIRRVAG